MSQSTNYIDLPIEGVTTQIETVPTVADLPPAMAVGSIRYVVASGSLYTYNGAVWVLQGGGGGGSGTVTAVSVTPINGVSGTVTNPTTTPAIALTLGAITPTSVAAIGAVSGSNLSGSNTGDQTISLTGDVTGSGTGSFTTLISAAAVTTGKLANNAVDLTTKVSGVLPIANGGTNSSTALNNNRILQSASGSIIEAAAITASHALASDANGIPVASATTATELSYVSGVTSAVQTQLNAKAAHVIPTTNQMVYVTSLTGSNITGDGSYDKPYLYQTELTGGI